MVYKKYIKRGKKIHGPYYYESYRDESGAIRKKYLGAGNPAHSFFRSFLFIFVLVIVVCFISFSFLIFYGKINASDLKGGFGEKFLEYFGSEVMFGPVCGNGVCESGEDHYACSDDCNVQDTLDNWIELAQTKRDMKKLFLDARDSLPLWNNGEDYGPIIRSQINALPAGGGEIVVPRGRYYLYSSIAVGKPNVSIRAESLGDVVFESQADGNMFYFNSNAHFARVENLILFGYGERNYGISVYGQNATIVSNAILNQDNGISLRMTSDGGYVADNYIFNAWYEPLVVKGSNRNQSTGVCPYSTSGVVIENNAVFESYQGIVFLCAENNTLINNIVMNSTLSGFRIETAKGNVLVHNFAAENGQDGINIYSNSDRVIIVNNTMIDNGFHEVGLWEDCWTPQPSIIVNYSDRYRGDWYPILRQENGNYIFTNYFCQFDAQQLEFRNDIDETYVYGNIIGVYRETPWKRAPHDLRVSYYPLFFSTRSKFVSEDNRFENNYFVNSGNNFIRDRGCGDVYLGNKVITFNPFVETELDVVYDEQNICSFDLPCTGADTACAVCNSNGICEPLDGERYSNCAADCPAKSLGQSGTRQYYDVCSSGLDMTELIFPAVEGCVNEYDGRFYCTDCGNGVCDFGESYCSCPTDCLNDKGCLSFKIKFDDGSEVEYVEPTFVEGGNCFYDDGRVNAAVSRDGTIYEMTLKPYEGVREVWFPYDSADYLLGFDYRDDLVYYPKLMGIAHRVTNVSNNGWSGLSESYPATYPGVVFSPMIVRTDGAHARMVAAANWPPLAVSPVYKTLRDALFYNISVEAGETRRFAAIVKETESVQEGVEPWQVAVDDYKVWLRDKMFAEGLWPVDYPSWLKSSYGWHHYNLPLNPRDETRNLSLTSMPFNLTLLDEKYSRWKGVFPWIQFWSQYSPWLNYYNQTATPTGLALNRSLHPRYGEPFIEFVEDVTNSGGHVGMYQRPLRWPENKPYYLLNDPSTYLTPDLKTYETPIEWLTKWIENTKSFGSDAYYLDVVGAVYLGEPDYMIGLFEDGTLPQASVIEFPVDIYPRAYLTGTSFSGQFGSDGLWGGPGIQLEGKYSKVVFPNFGRYLLGDRIFFVGESNYDHYLWGTNKEYVGLNRGFSYPDYINYCNANPEMCWYWVERQAFLVGGKFDAWHIEDNVDTPLVLDKIINQTVYQWEEKNWWARNPIYFDTKGIHDISDDSIDVRRFVDDEGGHLFTIDNPLKLSSFSFQFYDDVVNVNVPVSPGTSEPYQVYIYEYSGVPEGCVAEWQVLPWGECADGLQKREVIDVSGCGDLAGRPVSVSGCGESGGAGGSGGLSSSGGSYECSDGIDNDLDGLIDYPDDLGCDSLWDGSELGDGQLVGPIGCKPVWSCSSWGDCANGIKARECHDVNYCGTEFGKPVSEEFCDGLFGSIRYDFIFAGAIAGFGVLGVLVGAGIYFWRNRRAKEKSPA